MEVWLIRQATDVASKELLLDTAGLEPLGFKTTLGSI